MTEFGLDPTDMTAASAAVTDAAAKARTADGSAALRALAAAMPGSQTAAYLPDLGALWKSGVRGWCDDVDAVATGIDATTHEGSVTDHLIGELYDGVRILLGRGS